jgi:hypothetical protein
VSPVDVAVLGGVVVHLVPSFAMARSLFVVRPGRLQLGKEVRHRAVTGSRAWLTLRAVLTDG